MERNIMQPNTKTLIEKLWEFKFGFLHTTKIISCIPRFHFLKRRNASNHIIEAKINVNI